VINNLYNIASNALKNAQTSVNNAANNVANADTAGYQRTQTVYETGSSITIYGLAVGTGANIAAIVSLKDKFVEAQYLDASADLSRENAALTYLDQLDSLFNQAEGGLSEALSDYFDAWNELTADPDSLAGREALLGAAQTLIYALNSTSDQLDSMVKAVNAEIKDAVSTANQLIADIAAANAGIAANPDDNQLISDRDQMIRELNAIIGVDVIEQENGMVTILTDEGYSLVDGTETHLLVYATDRSTQSLMRGSDYDGELAFSGSSSEEIVIEFVTSGEDGTAQFKASLDGGKTWLIDDNGDTMLYTAGDADSPVTIAGVDIWFDGGTGDHAAGDTYTIVPKSGLYWESGDGRLVNITPLTDESGTTVSGRTASGALAGLFAARDDAILPADSGLDDLAEALVWEVNAIHSTGAGLTHHQTLTGSYAADRTDALLAQSGLPFADRITAGELELVTYDADGAVSASAIIAVDPEADSLDDLAAAITLAMGGELTASVNADGQLVLSTGSAAGFEIAADSSGLLAALGLNTFFTGSDASDIAVSAHAAANTSAINAGSLGSDGLAASGANDVAEAIAALSSASVQVGGQERSMSAHFAALVASVGSAASSATLRATYASTSADYYYQQQASASEVNVDEELIDLIKFQQAYQAAAQMITITRSMMDTVLDMV